MGKKSKIRYENNDGIIVIKVLGPSKEKMGEFKANQSDKKHLSMISTLIYDKYGIDLTPNYTPPKKTGMYDF